ncbi:MAG TPA: MgtC/SapB family protein [Tepidisphaeraceae bacterium]|nr:MgtC/SapB family protein [Tepidisphaeraceae bacterium]
MPVTIGWREISIRLALTLLAGALIGFNRGEHGRPAGMRTTILVCLAASLAMLQANLLMPTAGKAQNSFVVLDLMRLPLGILSGMGFIGAGAIIRRGSLVLGVTTAATLWFVTVIGLCFGGGQLGLGAVGLALGLVVLWLLKRVESAMPQDREASLLLESSHQGPGPDEIRSALLSEGFKIISMGTSYLEQGRIRKVRLQVRWRSNNPEPRQPEFLASMAQHPGVLKARWQP